MPGLAKNHRGHPWTPSKADGPLLPSWDGNDQRKRWEKPYPSLSLLSPNQRIRLPSSPSRLSRHPILQVLRPLLDAPLTSHLLHHLLRLSRRSPDGALFGVRSRWTPYEWLHPPLLPHHHPRSRLAPLYHLHHLTSFLAPFPDQRGHDLFVHTLLPHSPLRLYTPKKKSHLDPVDSELRSAPGVIGLGEGWAGGPQGKRKRRWFGRRRMEGSVVNADPLALWAIDEGNEPVLPMKAMWNRSKQRLFGASTSAINDMGEKRRWTFSRSRINLSDEKKSKRRTLPNFFTRYQADLGSSSIRHRGMSSSPSLPNLFPPAKVRTYAGMSKETCPRSDTHLVPQRSASLSNGHLNPRPSAPTPHRRPQSLVIAGHSHPAPVPELDERQASISSTSLETPVTDGPSQSLPRGATPGGVKLTRTSAFGAADFTTQKHMEEQNGVVGLDTLRSWAEEGQGNKQEREVMPMASPVSLRKQSILLRLKTAFSPISTPTSTPQSSRAPTPLPMRLFSRHSSGAGPSSAPAAPPDESSPASRIKEEAIHNSLQVPPPLTRPDSLQSRCRGSWMGNLSTEAWIKRLSRLSEDEGEDSSETRRSGSFFERILPARSSSLQTLGVSALTHQARPRMTASMSMPVLHLPLDFGEYGLEIDDILDNTRRRSIIDTFDSPLLPTQSEALATFAGWKGHSRGVSEPFEGTASGADKHRRNQSVPYSDIPLLEQHISGSEASTTNPVTPVLPGYFAPRPPLTPGQSTSTFRTEASYHSALEEPYSSGSSESTNEESSESPRSKKSKERS